MNLIEITCLFVKHFYRARGFPVGKITKKQSEGVRFLLIWHSKKYTPTDCFFGDFAH